MDYIFECAECGWQGERYSNLKLCPFCRAPISRVNDKVICFHGTDAMSALSIKENGFKPDSWFALHMEDAIKVSSFTILAVDFERSKIPKGWQFHVQEYIPASRITSVFQVIKI